MIRDYFYNDFPSQLRIITDGIRHEKINSKYVFFGGDEWKYFEEDMQKVPTENRPAFLLSLFMIILTDQAVYTYIPDLYHLWEAMTEFPKFGYCGTGPHNENPLWILAKADTDAELSQKVQALLPEFAKFLIDETKSYFAYIFGDHIDLAKYFKVIIGDGGYHGGYQIASKRPEDEELRNSKTVAAFKQCFEAELKNNNLI